MLLILGMFFSSSLFATTFEGIDEKGMHCSLRIESIGECRQLCFGVQEPVMWATVTIGNYVESKRRLDSKVYELPLPDDHKYPENYDVDPNLIGKVFGQFNSVPFSKRTLHIVFDKAGKPIFMEKRALEGSRDVSFTRNLCFFEQQN